METEIELRQFSSVMKILENNKFEKTRIVTILQQIQEEYRYLPQEVLTYLASALSMPLAEIYGVATFYAHFSLEPKGKYQIKVCDGTACHVKGSEALFSVLDTKLKLGGKITSKDLLFTVEKVSCLGACGLAPVLVVNERVYGQVNKNKTIEVIDEIIKSEANGNLE